jgi:hypothetical protein
MHLIYKRMLFVKIRNNNNYEKRKKNYDCSRPSYIFIYIIFILYIFFSSSTYSAV